MQGNEPDENTVDAMAQFARSAATAFQNSTHFATQAEDALANAVLTMVNVGMTVDAIAAHVGLRREYVVQLLEGERLAHRLL